MLCLVMEPPELSPGNCAEDTISQQLYFCIIVNIWDIVLLQFQRRSSVLAQPLYSLFVNACVKLEIKRTSVSRYWKYEIGLLTTRAP
ncbi:hypothetical protein AV530_001617 [Patagioenas fasciata monilis]|uniref:Uncharacterized protein n=1 Tax=Patagioenas fasciata monilis TaxID=372326 RepID=A0A1V4K4W1_PATFA|nr:hypothetical protein AV530_001617 [Patagioenas fasciata monilis]